MGVLDSVVKDVGSQLGISSSSAGAVLSGLLSVISLEDGGVGGFLDRFRRAGVGSLVASWFGGDVKAVSADAVEGALGHDTIDGIASRAGLSFSTAASAIAIMLPKVIRRLAPGGAIPSRLSPDYASYITGPTAAMASGARQAAAYSANTLTRSAGLGRYLWPLLALLLVTGLVFYWLARSATTVDQGAVNIEEHVVLNVEFSMK